MDKDTSHYDHLEAAKRPASDTSKGETSGKDQSIYDKQLNKIVRRLDWRLMPLMMVTYSLGYWDKGMLSQAAIFNIRQDLNFYTPSSRYSLVSSFFYVGYLVGCFPCSYLAQKLPLNLACSVLVFLWGLTLLATIWTTNYPGILAQRFFLGFIEAAVAPTFTAAVSSWYPKRRQALRSALWYASSPLSLLFCTYINYGLGTAANASSNPYFDGHGWRAMYIFAGLLTICWSGVVFLAWPNSIDAVRWLNDDEKKCLSEAIRENNAGSYSRKFRLDQFLECFFDPNIIGLFLMAFCSHWINGAVSSFGAILFQKLEFNTLQNFAMLSANGVFGAFSALWPPFISARYPGWLFHFYTFGMCFRLAGSLGMWLPEVSKTQAAAFVLLGGFATAASCTIGLASSNVGGYTKRLAAGVWIFIGYCLSNIGSPLTFHTSEAPKFSTGFRGCVIVACCGMGIAQALRFILMRRNKKRQADHGDAGNEHGLDDISDQKNKDFRYLL